MAANFRGGFVTDPAALEAAFGPAVYAMVGVLAYGVSEAAPVLTGWLATSFVEPGALSLPDWVGPETLMSADTTGVPYARYQEYVTRNAGYAEAGIDAVAVEAVGAAAAAVRVLPLWSNAD